MQFSDIRILNMRHQCSPFVWALLTALICSNKKNNKLKTKTKIFGLIKANNKCQNIDRKYLQNICLKPQSKQWQFIETTLVCACVCVCVLFYLRFYFMKKGGGRGHNEARSSGPPKCNQHCQHASQLQLQADHGLSLLAPRQRNEWDPPKKTEEQVEEKQERTAKESKWSKWSHELKLWLHNLR